LLEAVKRFGQWDWHSMLGEVENSALQDLDNLVICLDKWRGHEWPRKDKISGRPFGRFCYWR
jgi:hypothetical protein